MPHLVSYNVIVHVKKTLRCCCTYGPVLIPSTYATIATESINHLSLLTPGGSCGGFFPVVACLLLLPHSEEMEGREGRREREKRRMDRGMESPRCASRVRCSIPEAVTPTNPPLAWRRWGPLRPINTPGLRVFMQNYKSTTRKWEKETFTHPLHPPLISSTIIHDSRTKRTCHTQSLTTFPSFLLFLLLLFSFKVLMKYAMLFCGDAEKNKNELVTAFINPF